MHAALHNKPMKVASVYSSIINVAYQCLQSCNKIGHYLYSCYEKFLQSCSGKCKCLQKLDDFCLFLQTCSSSFLCQQWFQEDSRFVLGCRKKIAQFFLSFWTVKESSRKYRLRWLCILNFFGGPVFLLSLI